MSGARRASLFKHMARPRAYKVTIYLEEAFRGQSDRIWNNLAALDCMILEEYKQAGVVIAEMLTNDLALIEGVPGVQAAKVEEVKPEADPPRFRLEPRGATKAMSEDKRSRKTAQAVR